MNSLDRCWPTIGQVLAICRSAPGRFLTSSQRRLMLEVEATLDEVRLGLDAVEQAILTLGPPETDEPSSSQFLKMTPLADELNAELFEGENPDPKKWRQVFDRWSSRHPSDDILPGAGVSWGGLARLWTRARVGHVTAYVIRSIPRVRPEPGSAGSHAIDRTPEIIWLLEDSSRAAWIGFYISVLQDACMPLTTEVYHHPTSGERTRSTIESNVFPEDMEYILAHPPKTHRVPPWRPPR